jgi:hypothetical protein
VRTAIAPKARSTYHGSVNDPPSTPSVNLAQKFEKALSSATNTSTPVAFAGLVTGQEHDEELAAAQQESVALAIAEQQRELAEDSELAQAASESEAAQQAIDEQRNIAEDGELARATHESEIVQQAVGEAAAATQESDARAQQDELERAVAESIKVVQAEARATAAEKRLEEVQLAQALTATRLAAELAARDAVAEQARIDKEKEVEKNNQHMTTINQRLATDLMSAQQERRTESAASKEVQEHLEHEVALRDAELQRSINASASAAHEIAQLKDRNTSLEETVNASNLAYDAVHSELSDMKSYESSPRGGASRSPPSSPDGGEGILVPIDTSVGMKEVQAITIRHEQLVEDLGLALDEARAEHNEVVKLVESHILSNATKIDDLNERVDACDQVEAQLGRRIDGNDKCLKRDA